MSIRKLEEGIALSFSLFLEGKEVKFRLAVAASKDLFGEKDVTEYIYLSEDGKTYCNGTYSGGNTGAGANPRNFQRLGEKHYGREPLRVVTMDPAEMLRIAEEEEREEAERRASSEARENARVQKINALPKETFLMAIAGLNFYAIRSDAGIGRYGRADFYITLNYDWKEREDKNFSSLHSLHLENFITSDKKIQIGKFKRDIPYLFGTPTVRELLKNYDNEELKRLFFTELRGKFEEVKRQVMNI